MSCSSGSNPMSSQKDHDLQLLRFHHHLITK